MKVDGVSAPISPPIVRPQALPKSPESEPEVTAGEDGGGKVNGVISKLNEGGHFKGVAAVRLLISHFDNAGLDKIAPDLLPAPEDVPGKAYEKFLEQYQALYNASLAPTEPEDPAVEIPVPDPAPVIEEPIVEVPPVSDGPVAEIPVPDPVPVEEPIVEVPPIFEELPPAEEPVSDVPVIEPIIVTPLEIEPLAIIPEPTTPEAPVDESNGIFAAFEEFLQTQVSQENPGALDIVI